MSTDVVIHEPLGQRRAQLPLLIGGASADVMVPGEIVPMRIESDGRQWLLRAVDAATVIINGSAQPSPAVLADQDVVRAGDAMLVLRPAAGRIDVTHLAGNHTVAPVVEHVLPGEEVVASVREIIAAGSGAGGQASAARAPAQRMPVATRLALGIIATLAIAAGWLFMNLVPVAVNLTPAAAHVEVKGWLDWQSGGRVFLMKGNRELEFSHPGYRSQRITLAVSRDLADAAALPVALQLLPGKLTVDTHGEAAELLVDGVSMGQVPGDVQVEPGAHDLIVRAPRRIDFVTRLEIEGGGKAQSLDVQLQPSTGWLALDTLPAAAQISIDGEMRGAAPQKVELDSGLHKLVITAAGRRSWNSQIAIIAGKTLDLGRVDLAAPAPAMVRGKTDTPVTSAPAIAAAQPEAPAPAPPPPPPARLKSAMLGTLVLFPAGSYQQGSERREQGRRANEVQRMVTLTRPFYMAEAEVSNAQFRSFRANHSAGLAADKSLDLDSQAVSNVSWDEGVEFCNWLSLREGLPAAYERRDGRWQLLQPVNTGYRLPTEAEWEYAARYVDGRRWQRYAWGDTLPPPAAAANVAGQESLPTKPGPEVRLAAALPDYRDEHPVVAPVGSYTRSAGGLLNMGGNVSEWVHDVFASMPEAVAVTDPMGPATEGAHGIRGASWRTAAIAELRLAWRERANGPSQTIGFRVARYAEVTP